MTEVRIGDQTVRYDREATAAIYEILPHGDPEECGCIFCKNFAAQRNLVYPACFAALLEQLGIDPNKEGEVFEYGPSEDGVHFYGGWFYFVGQMVTAGERNSDVPDSHYFTFWFSANCPDAPAFHGWPVLAIEFTTRVKWVLPEAPQYGTTSGERSEQQ